MDFVWIRWFPREDAELMTGLYRQSRNAPSFSKALVNNIAASPPVTYQIQCSVCTAVFTPSVTAEPGDPSQARSRSPIASVLWGWLPRRPRGACLRVVFTRSPSASHTSSSAPHRTFSLLPPFPFSVLPSTFFPFPSQSSSLGRLSCGALVSPDYHVRKWWPRSERPAHSCQAGKKSQAECGQRRWSTQQLPLNICWRHRTVVRATVRMCCSASELVTVLEAFITW